MTIDQSRISLLVTSLDQSVLLSPRGKDHIQEIVLISIVVLHVVRTFLI